MTQSKLVYYWRWLTSKKVRVAADLRHQAWKMLNAQRDILSEKAMLEVQESIDDLTRCLRTKTDDKDLEKAMQTVEKTANAWFKPYASPGLRENIEVFLVAGAVALAVRTFFLQPMAIPTGSAQPTLWGITHENLIETGKEVPSGFKKFYLSWVKGEKYYHKTAEQSGQFEIMDPEPKRVFLFIKKQRFRVGNKVYTQWFPPDGLWKRADLYPGAFYFEKGQDIYKLKVNSGDHLFVNRMVYNFRQPRRGETIVFVSAGIDHLIANTHYIKRLIGMGGERIRIGNDRHVVINDRRLTANDPGFEFVYGFNGPPRPDVYSGHVNNHVAIAGGGNPAIARGFPSEGYFGFPDGNYEFQIPEDHYMAFGDNTMNSFDSRDWGPFPKQKVIGRAGFVFWPITERFGWHRK